MTLTDLWDIVEAQKGRGYAPSAEDIGTINERLRCLRLVEVTADALAHAPGAHNAAHALHALLTQIMTGQKIDTIEKT